MPSNVLVSGLSDTQYNGIYLYDGLLNGYPSYVLSTDSNVSLYVILNGPEGSAWYMYEGETMLLAFWSYSEGVGNYPSAYPWLPINDSIGGVLDSTGLLITEYIPSTQPTFGLPADVVALITSRFGTVANFLRLRNQGQV